MIDDTTSGEAVEVEERAVTGDVWLTPLEIAHSFRYQTDKPIRKAIDRGELRAHRTPCGRMLLVNTREYDRWRDEVLPYTAPRAATNGAGPVSSKSRSGRRRATPTLNYTRRSTT